MTDTFPDVALIIAIGTMLFLLLSAFIAFMTLMYQKRRLQHQEEVTGLQQAYQKEILKAQLEMQEQTFLSISQEIHDNVGQILSLVRLNISTLGSASGTSATEKVETSKALLDQAIQDLRDLSRRLNSRYVAQQPLGALLKFQLELIRKTGAVETYLEEQGEETELNAEKKLIVFRIAQEALNNCLRHAQASTISVRLFHKAGKVSLSISDDGKGYTAPDQPAARVLDQGTGTYNMRYRAGLIGGTLSIQGNRGTGTLVQLELPLN